MVNQRSAFETFSCVPHVQAAVPLLLQSKVVQTYFQSLISLDCTPLVGLQETRQGVHAEEQDLHTIQAHRLCI